mmetsp:Transcript_40112/g.72204  ORF Transcript_40112/g.72204 Transcript_40112/m.72204 type:complete len:81 (-) Transcript_40112:2100-2342(-)
MIRHCCPGVAVSWRDEDLVIPCQTWAGGLKDPALEDEESLGDLYSSMGDTLGVAAARGVLSPGGRGDISPGFRDVRPRVL